MGLLSTVRKGLVIAAKIVKQFEEAPSIYTPTSKLGKVLQRITDRLAGNATRSITRLTPLLAPTVLFTQASGYIKQGVAFQGSWRRFLVQPANQGTGELSRTSSEAPYTVDITIEVGYPETPTVKVGTSVYTVDDLKSEDARIIDAMMWSDVLSNPSQIAGVGLKELGGWYDVGNSVRRGRYVFEVVES